MFHPLPIKVGDVIPSPPSGHIAKDDYAFLVRSLYPYATLVYVIHPEVSITLNGMIAAHRHIYETGIV
jgi:hypothetical protein